MLLTYEIGQGRVRADRTMGNLKCDMCKKIKLILICNCDMSEKCYQFSIKTCNTVNLSTYSLISNDGNLRVVLSILLNL